MKEPLEVTSGKVIPEYPYSPTGVRLYGVPAEYVDVRGYRIRVEVCHRPAGDATTRLALIYGYAYEGHCYSLPKPCIVAVEGDGVCAAGCGYGEANRELRELNDKFHGAASAAGSATQGGGGATASKDGATKDCDPVEPPPSCDRPPRFPEYRMWTADKLTKTFEISISSGFIEDIILQQNVGGPKPPVAYGARVQLAHRGGKLTE